MQISLWIHAMRDAHLKYIHRIFLNFFLRYFIALEYLHLPQWVSNAIFLLRTWCFSEEEFENCCVCGEKKKSTKRVCSSKSIFYPWFQNYWFTCVTIFYSYKIYCHRCSVVLLQVYSYTPKYLCSLGLRRASFYSWLRIDRGSSKRRWNCLRCLGWPQPLAMMKKERNKRNVQEIWVKLFMHLLWRINYGIIQYRLINYKN